MTFKEQAWDFFKRNFAVLLVGIVAIVLYFSGCGHSGGGKTVSDTTSHTVQVPQPIIIYPPYTPTQSGGTVYVPIPQSAQGVVPASTMEGLISQVKDLSARIEALGREYYAVKHYEDSIQLKDTSGTRVGVVNLKQTVSENTLKSTQPSYQLSFPHTTTTITNTVYPKPRNKVYLGIGAESLLNEMVLDAVKGSVLFQNKKENILEVGALYNFLQKKPGIEISYYRKLSFKKIL